MLSTRFTSLAAAAVLATGVVAQKSKPFTDPTTGITFMANTDKASGFQWGVATPSTITTDFIGFMSYPLKDGAGYGGVSLGGGGKMAGPALVVTWPNEGKVVHSYRQASSYDNPAELTGKGEIVPIESGTIANATHVQFTYLCKGCVDATLTFDATADKATVLGFALCTKAPNDPADTASMLSYHDGGFGQAGFDIPGSASADYDTWAALAGGAAPPTEPPSTEAPPTEPSTTAAPPTEPSTTVAPPTEPTSTEAPPAEPTSTEAPPTEPTSTVAPPPTEPSSTEAPPTEPSTTAAPTAVPTPTTCAARRRKMKRSNLAARAARK